MGIYDFEEELSDPDDFLDDDIQSLSLACMPPSSANPIPNAQAFSSSDNDDDDDDLELVRRIKEQYGLGASDISQPLSLKPLISLPPISDDDDDDDDFQTLRAIQSRFSLYASSPPLPTSNSNAYELKSNNNGVVEPPVNNGSECLDVHGEEDVNMQIPSCTISTSGFPTAAQTFVEAIKRNRSCQKILRTKMLHVESRMEELKEVLKRVKTLRDFQVQCKKKIGRALSQKQDARVHLILPPPRLRANAKGCEKKVSALGPLENSHVAVYKTALKAFPLSFRKEKWSKNETQVLHSEIKKQFQERLFQKSADILSALEEPGGAAGVDSMISSITNLDITPDIIQEFSGKVDWNQLASGLPRRTGAECEARWLNHENCLINHGEWTSDEDKHILLLIQKTGNYNWSYIAEQLGTNRTPFQCLARFQRSLNANILKRDWTEDEDVQLRSAVETFGGSNWQVVASVIEGRTGTQCSQRWTKTLLPARERVGKWSIDEDKRLKVAGALFGYKSWHRIANFVPGRTQAQCRERWKNVLDPSLNQGQWTEEEDLKLKAAIAVYGYCWSKVAVCVPSRTDSQCRRRWKKLFPQDVPLLKAARETQKAALITNFVDRESYRPALGVNDFVPLPIEGSTVLGNEIVSQQQNKPRKRRKTNPTRELVSSCDPKGSGSRKRKRRDVSMSDNNDCDEFRTENECDTIEIKMKSSSRSGCKRKKASGNLNISTKPKKSKTKLRTQGDDVIEAPLICDRTVVDTSTHVHYPNQNNRKKKRKSQTENSLEWQDLPLATLFSKAATRIRGRISIVKPPIRYTYVRRNKKGTLDSAAV